MSRMQKDNVKSSFNMLALLQIQFIAPTIKTCIFFNFPIGYPPSQSFNHTSTITCLIATHLAQVAARHLNSIEFEMEVEIEIEIDCEVVAAVAVVVAI